MTLRARILTGDALEVLRLLPAGAARCCVTSPPYWGLRDYGVEGQLGLEPTPEEYVEKLVAVFREVRRVLADDGTVWVNLGDSYCNSDKWGGGGVNTGKHTKSPDGSVPSWIAVRRRWANVPGLKPKDLVGIPWRVAFALQANGWYLRSDIIWAKPNPMPESVTDRPTKAHEYLFMLSKRERYYYDAGAIREPHKPESLARYEYGLHTTAPTDGKVSAGGASAGNVRHIGRSDRMGDNINYDGRNRRSVWTIATQPYPEAHFATFPEALVEPCILAGSAPGDVVLDPFAGSGTTGAVALRLRRDFIGIELNPAYVELAVERVGSVAPLFSTVETPSGLHEQCKPEIGGAR